MHLHTVVRGIVTIFVFILLSKLLYHLGDMPEAPKKLEASHGKEEAGLSDFIMVICIRPYRWNMAPWRGRQLLLPS